LFFENCEFSESLTEFRKAEVSGPVDVGVLLWIAKAHLASGDTRNGCGTLGRCLDQAKASREAGSQQTRAIADEARKLLEAFGKPLIEVEKGR